MTPTKGPLKNNGLRDIEGFKITNRDGWVIATVTIQTTFIEDVEQAEAYATLFTAAPDMLEALNHCLAIFNSMADRGRYPDELIPNNPHYLGKQGFEFLINATNKAEGRKVKP